MKWIAKRRRKKVEEPAGLEGWPAEFGEAERDYLYEESRTRLAQLLEFTDRQEQKAFTLTGLSIALIGASGIFGDLRLERTLRGSFTLLALVATAGVAYFVLKIMWPREWETGTNVSWLHNWRGASVRELKDAALEALVDGFTKNEKLIRVRGDQLVWLLWALLLQAALLIAVQLAAPHNPNYAPSLSEVVGLPGGGADRGEGPSPPERNGVLGFPGGG